MHIKNWTAWERPRSYLFFSMECSRCGAKTLVTQISRGTFGQWQAMLERRISGRMLHCRGAFLLGVTSMLAFVPHWNAFTKSPFSVMLDLKVQSLLFNSFSRVHAFVFKATLGVCTHGVYLVGLNFYRELSIYLTHHEIKGQLLSHIHTFLLKCINVQRKITFILFSSLKQTRFRCEYWI